MSEHTSHLPFDVDPRDLASQHVDDQLAAYTGGECSEIERVAIERHLEGCAACREALDETRRIRGLLAQLGSQATPPSLADTVLARLVAAIGEEPVEPYSDGSSAMEGSAQGIDCPVSPIGSVPLPVAYLEPRHRRGQTPSTWRRGEDAQERDSAIMERETSTGTQTQVQQTRNGNGRTATGERLRSFAAVVAAVLLVALGVGVFGLMSHRGTSSPGGRITSPGGPITSTPSVPGGVSVDLPANSMLSDISMVSATEGWAVGTVDNEPNGMGGAKNVLLAHYDGHSWTTSSDSTNFKQGQLTSVSMVSADDGWAAGSIDTTPGRGLLLHFTGGHWHEVDISKTGIMGGGKVVMLSANEGWLYTVAGEKPRSKNDTGTIRTLVIHYHNGTWQLFSTLPGWNTVSMLSASEGWAVNQTTNAILHYQAGTWNQVATAPGQSPILEMVSPTEGWIAGSAASGQRLFAMRYDGHGWTQMTLSSTGYSDIQQIAVAAPGDVWLFGETTTDTRWGKAAWHYSKGKWTRIDLAVDADAITGASMASLSAGWLVGATGTDAPPTDTSATAVPASGPNRAVLMRYDQGNWMVVYYGK